jgi:hypothetical protein
MSVNDELHKLVDQLNENGAREALAYPQDLHRRKAPSGWRDLRPEE